MAKKAPALPPPKHPPSRTPSTTSASSRLVSLGTPAGNLVSVASDGGGSTSMGGFDAALELWNDVAASVDKVGELTKQAWVATGGQNLTDALGNRLSGIGDNPLVQGAAMSGNPYLQAAAMGGAVTDAVTGFAGDTLGLAMGYPLEQASEFGDEAQLLSGAKSGLDQLGGLLDNGLGAFANGAGDAMDKAWDALSSTATGLTGQDAIEALDNASTFEPDP